MKKYLAAGLAAVMVFALAGCGASKVVEDTTKAIQEVVEEEEELTSVTGTWVSDKINVADSFGEGIDEGIQEPLGTDVSFKDYVDEIYMRANLVLSEDDTFSLSFTMDEDRSALDAGFPDYLRAAFSDAVGEELSDEDILDLFDIDVNTYAGESFSPDVINKEYESYTVTGTYTFEDDVVTMIGGGYETIGKLDGSKMIVDDAMLGRVIFTHEQ